MKIYKRVFGEEPLPAEKVDTVELIHVNPVDKILITEMGNGFEIYGTIIDVHIAKTADGKNKIFIQPGRLK